MPETVPRPTTLLRASRVLHAMSLLLLWAVLLLPATLGWYLIVAGIVLAWRPLVRLVGAGSVASAAVALGVAMLLVSSVALPPELANTAVFCCIWLLAYILGADCSIGILIGALALASSLAAGPSAAFGGLAAAGTAVGLLGAGACAFLGHLPRTQDAVGSRKPRFLPAVLVVMLPALAVALIADDWLGQMSVHLAPYLPTPSGGKDTVSLVARPPRPRGRPVCEVLPLEGGAPAYLAARQFWSYHDGKWQNGEKCANPGKRYGTVSDRTGELRRCTVTMIDSAADRLVPHGVVHPTATEASVRGPRTTEYAWQTRPPQTAVPTSATEKPQLPRLVQSAELLCRDLANDMARIAAIQGYLQQSQLYDVSSAFAVGDGADPNEHFLFRSKRGWCVHFASASVLMLRAVKIPSRLVTGYMCVDDRGGKIADHASHAWCEALVETPTGKRWLIVDPSVAPSATAQLHVEPKLIAGLLLLLGLGGFLCHGLWRHRVGDLRRDAQTEIDGDAAAGAIVATYRRMLRYLERQGIHRPPSLTPREFVEVCVPPRQQADCRIITQAFERVHYMGFHDVGPLWSAVDQAQRRLLGLRG